jgi:hypothetical protein
MIMSLVVVEAGAVCTFILVVASRPARCSSDDDLLSNSAQGYEAGAEPAAPQEGSPA